MRDPALGLRCAIPHWESGLPKVRNPALAPVRNSALGKNLSTAAQMMLALVIFEGELTSREIATRLPTLDLHPVFQELTRAGLIISRQSCGCSHWREPLRT